MDKLDIVQDKNKSGRDRKLFKEVITHLRAKVHQNDKTTEMKNPVKE